MKSIMTCVLAALAALNLAAMPTEKETARAEPLVKKLMASEWAAFESGTMTRSEVASAAMQLAGLTDTEAAKLLLMKGAFVLYVRDGNLEQAVKTMNSLESAVSDLPPQSVSNMVELALLGVSNKVDGVRLHHLLAARKPQAANVQSPVRDRTTVQSIIDGMIKVPGRDYWLSETELTQGQWEAVMGYNLSGHKGANLPVECVSRDDCDVFLEKLNQAKEVQASQFEFALPSMEEWRLAVSAGGSGNDIWIKPGVAGNILDMAWVGENSSTQTHVVATKSANAFGLYDMMGNVWEWVSNDAESRGTRRGGSAFRLVAEWPMSRWIYTPRGRRYDDCGLRVAAHIRTDKTIPAQMSRSGDRLLGHRNETKDAVSVAKAPAKAAKDRDSVKSIIDGMIKVPGRDVWLSETEVTQSQWEKVMGYNLSEHKGANLPVEGVSRDDCDVFLEKLNQTEEVQSSQFEFVLPSSGDWEYAAAAGGAGDDCWIRPGVVGNILEMAWAKENSTDQTHEVATKPANAFGFYDMLGNVWEWMNERGSGARGLRFGGSYFDAAADVQFRLHHGWLTPRTRRYGLCGLRVAARIRSKNNKALKLNMTKESAQQQASVDGYTWSYRVNNGEAIIVAGTEGNHTCAVSPNPKGHLAIPATIEGVKVTSIGEHAFFGCGELNSVTIPVGVKNIRNGAFYYCSGLTSISISSSVTDIVPTAFVALHSVKSFSVAPDNPSYSSRNGLLCSKDGSVLVAGVNGDVTIPSGVKTIGRQAFLGRGLDMTVKIPSSVTKIEERAFAYCLGLTSVTMCGERPEAPDDVFSNCGQLTAIHVPANAKSWAGMKEWQGEPLAFDAAPEKKVDLTVGEKRRGIKDRTTVQSIIDGMLKVPGKDCWLSATELTQGQWEAVMGNNCSLHRGANLPVENVSRDDCDEFLGKLNQTEEVRASRFEFCMPSLPEWKYAAQAGGPGTDCWIGRGVAGSVPDMAWVKENSGGQTHAVATKTANAWGFYDMVGNVWEWMVGENLTVGCRHGFSFADAAGECSTKNGFHTARNIRDDHCGLRLAAHIRPAVGRNEGNQDGSIIDRLKTKSK